MTVPNNPVIAERGISDAVNVLDNISANIINIEPKSIDIGSVTLESLPTISLTIWGITNPIQLIVPAKETELAVSIVATTIINSLYAS